MFSGVLSEFQRRVSPRSFFLALLTLAATTGSLALEPATPLSRLGRQAWTMENGLPQNTISVLLQSQSGFLWAGTELGLARFDGAGFRIFDHANAPAFPDAEIRCLFDTSKDTSLWVGTSDGLVRWLNGAATRFTTADGLPGNSIRAITETTDGILWVWTEAGLARLEGNRFHTASDAAMPPESIRSIAAGFNATLWVATSAGVFMEHDGHWNKATAVAKTSDFRQPFSEQPSMVKAIAGGSVLLADSDGVRLASATTQVLALPRTALPSDGVTFLEQLAGGTVVVASKSQVVLAQETGNHWHVTGRFAVAKELPGSRIESLYADREGTLWIGTNHGLARILVVGDQPKVERMPATDPLATDTILSLLEDREGDIWAGTESAGLHILRDSRFHLIGVSDGLTSDATTAIVEGIHQSASTGIWIGTRDSGINHLSFSSGGVVTSTSLTTKDGLLSNVILSLASALNGDLWVGTPDGLNRIAGKSITGYTSADGLPDDFIRSVLVVPDGSLWIGTRRGLTHLKPNPQLGKFETYTHADGLGSDLVGALALGRDGALWIATLNGLTRYQNGRFRNYTTADGLSSNVITALEATADGMLWIGTQGEGINLWNGRQFRSVRPPASNPNALPKVIHAILDDQANLWLASDFGLTRIDRSYARACAQPAGCSFNSAATANFTTADGLRSRETSSNSHPTATHASNGLLWFTTPRGVIQIDPLHFPAAPPPPPVAIERFAVDDHDDDHAMKSAAGPARITAGALRFQFDYAGLSFSSPQKLRYQYKLEGFDHDWIDAGARKTAYYTNIPAAKYTFRVRAALGDAALQTASNDPSYTPQEATLSFELEPHFYQTIWFRALVALLFAALIFYVFRRRVIRVEREFGAVMGERNRIAREIHDTLAQGYVGISLQLEILGQLLGLNRTEAAQKHLILTQQMVREGLDDARQSIWALRSQDAAEQTLPIRLRRLVEQAADPHLTSDFKVHGAVRPLSPEAEQEILRIAQESIHNVKKHAGASRLDVRLDYEQRVLALTIADNGKGFQFTSEQPKPEGHYGLTGMQERAALIDAEIAIESQPALGTTVKLKVPAPGAQ